MRMRRKKNLDTRMDRIAERVIDLSVEDRRFDGTAGGMMLDLSALFGNDHPVELEIGCGKGGFIVEIAARHPEIDFLAVEKYGNVLVSAAEAVAEKGLKNVRFLWGDAEYLPRFIPPHSISRLYLNFSTPFPKKKHITHRLTHRHFLEMYRQLLTPGATVIQKTDNRPFFEFSLEEYAAAGYTLRQVSWDLHADGYPDNIVTEYERKFMEQGLPIYRAETTV